jgi:hypothetical protein
MKEYLQEGIDKGFFSTLSREDLQKLYQNFLRTYHPDKLGGKYNLLTEKQKTELNTKLGEITSLWNKYKKRRK